MRLLSIIMAASVGVGLWLPAANAQSLDPMIEGAKQCTRNISRYERQYGIPTHLLSAISANESGRYHQGLKIALPWPWTINVEGKGYYYDSKQEAIAAVRQFQSDGARSIDVGCMQVNLVHHADAFANLEDAFNPEKNVAYAASFLRSLFEEERSWKKAAAHYHSKTPSRGTEYASRVYDRWFNLVDRLRQANAPVEPATIAAMNETGDGVAKPVELIMANTQNNPPKIVNVIPTTPLAEQAGRKVAAFAPTRMNSIQVSGGDDSHAQGVLVIRPTIRVVDDAPAQMASLQPETLTLADVRPVSSNVRSPHVIHVSPSQAPKRAGPNFIFDN